MKLIKYRFLNTLLFLSALLLFSCEKGLDTIEVESTVYIPNSGLTQQSVLLGESVYKLGVYNAGVNQPNGSVIVNLAVDNEAFANFLTTNPGYEILPASFYSIPANEVTFQSGNPRADFHIHLKNIDESLATKKYVLPVSIVSANANVKINEDKKIAFLYFSKFRSVYESKYKAYGEVKDPEDKVHKKIDEVISPASIAVNTIELNGPETGMKLRLAVANNKVVVTGAPGSEAFNIQNEAGKESIYSGDFDELYQSNKGTFKLFYTYTVSGKLMKAAIDLSFTL